jgi:hypothetical protein
LYSCILVSCFLAATLEAPYIPTYTGSSQGINIPAVEGGRTELELADINADSHLDILSFGDRSTHLINTQENGVMVWFGDRAGNWSVFWYRRFGYVSITLGDINNEDFPNAGYDIYLHYSGTDLGD